MTSYGVETSKIKEAREKAPPLRLSSFLSRTWVLVPNGSLMGFFDWVRGLCSMNQSLLWNHVHLPISYKRLGFISFPLTYIASFIPSQHFVLAVINTQHLIFNIQHSTCDAQYRSLKTFEWDHGNQLHQLYYLY